MCTWCGVMFWRRDSLFLRQIFPWLFLVRLHGPDRPPSPSSSSDEADPFPVHRSGCTSTMPSCNRSQHRSLTCVKCCFPNRIFRCALPENVSSGARGPPLPTDLLAFPLVPDHVRSSVDASQPPPCPVPGMPPGHVSTRRHVTGAISSPAPSTRPFEGGDRRRCLIESLDLPRYIEIFCEEISMGTVAGKIQAAHRRTPSARSPPC